MALDTSGAPISSLIGLIVNPLSTALSTYAGGLITALQAPIATAFGIWMIIKATQMMKGMDEGSLIDFSWFLMSFFIVLSMMTTYQSQLMPFIQNLASSGVTGETTLDQVAKYYVGIFEASDVAVKDVGGLDGIVLTINVGIKKLIVLLGLVPFLIAATLIYISLKVGLLMVLALGPLFIAFGLFPATRQWASAFINTVLSYVLGFALLGVIALASINLSKEMFTAPDGTLVNATMPLVIYAAIGNLLLVFLLKQVASIASSLSAGGINAGTASGSIGGIAKGITGSFARNAKGKGTGLGSSFIDAGRGALKFGRRLRNKLNPNNIKAG